MSLLLTNYEDRPNDKLLYMGFNPDHTCLAVGISSGFRVFNCDPYKKTYKREFSGGIAIVSMLFRSNILALVGGGSEPAWESSQILIWDNYQKRAIAELSFQEDVLGVKIRKDRIIVSLLTSVEVYGMEKLVRTNQFKTYKNRRGVLAVSQFSRCMAAFPGEKRGEITVVDLDRPSSALSFKTGEDKLIGSLALSSDGKKVGVSFVKGAACVKIFSTARGELLSEVTLRESFVFCISFNKDSSKCCFSTDRGTTYVLDIRQKKVMDVAVFKGPENPSVCCFGKTGNTVLLMSSTGLFYKLIVEKKDGKSELKEEKIINLFPT